MDFSESDSDFIFKPRPRPIPEQLGPDKPPGFLVDRSEPVRPGVDGRGDRDGDELAASSVYGFLAARGDCGRGELEAVGVERP